MKPIYFIGVLAVLLLVAGCAKEAVEPAPVAPVTPPTPPPVVPDVPVEPEPAPAPEEATVNLVGQSAEPAEVTIKAGGTVVFNSDAGNQVMHTIRLYQSGGQVEVMRTALIKPGESSSIIIEEAGEYDFRSFPMSAVSGTITVE